MLQLIILLEDEYEILWNPILNEISFQVEKKNQLRILIFLHNHH